jgi:hypothetical protein
MSYNHVHPSFIMLLGKSELTNQSTTQSINPTNQSINPIHQLSIGIFWMHLPATLSCLSNSKQLIGSIILYIHM